MKIDLVLTACNNVYKYISYYPIVYKVWKKRFNLDLYLILINDEIPEFLQKYKDTIILFPEFDNIHSGFISQAIRILYPALFENKNILITDMDILPISKKYFIDSISIYDDKKFITYTDRYINRKNQDPLYAICYNVANSNTWKEIFNINNKNDIKNKLKEWYDTGYTGKKNCPGWYKDQLKLYEYVQNWERKNKDLIILKDKDLGYKRLDKRNRIIIEVLRNWDRTKNEIKNGIYSDIHITKRIPDKKLQEFVDLLI